MHEAMSYHFVFPLEALAAFATGAAFHRTVVRAALGMNVCVRAVRVLVIEFRIRRMNFLQMGK